MVEMKRKKRSRMAENSRALLQQKEDRSNQRGRNREQHKTAPEKTAGHVIQVLCRMQQHALPEGGQGEQETSLPVQKLLVFGARGLCVRVQTRVDYEHR